METMLRFFSAIKSFFLKIFGKKQPPLLPRRIFFHYAKGFLEDAEEDVYYADSYFCEDSSKANPSLAVCSLGLAMSAFSSNHLKEGFEKQAVNVIEFMGKCGFSDVEVPPYFSRETTEEGIAYAIGKKTIKHRKKPFILLSIGVRGGNYGKEWSSNAYVGEGNRHKGFDLAASEIVEATKAYIQKHRIRGEVRVWVSGFSRAAAVSNLFSVSLPRQIGKAHISEVYAYCFACPNVAKEIEETITVPHNYVGSADLVAMLPLKKWGFARYGEDTMLPPLSPMPFSSVSFSPIHVFNKQKRFIRTDGLDKAKFLAEAGDYLGERITLPFFLEYCQDAAREFLALVDPTLENPYSVVGGVFGETFKGMIEEYGIPSLLLKAASSKTNWDEAIRPVLERVLESKPYSLNSDNIVRGLTSLLFLLRKDVLKDHNFFLTMCDGANMASALNEHKAALYLAYLKGFDPNYKAD